MKPAGGVIYLHKKKAEASYFGGRVEGFTLIDTDRKHSRRVVFTLRSLAEGKGVRWRGASHGRAWTGGLVEDDAE